MKSDLQMRDADTEEEAIAEEEAVVEDIMLDKCK